MKKLLVILVLSFLWCNVGIATENAEELNKNCIRKGTTEFNKKVKQRVKKNFVTVMYFGCKSMDSWNWNEETRKDLDTSHQVAYKKCLKGASEYKIETCHLFSINDKIVYGKDAAFVAKVEKDIKTRLAKNNKLGSADYVQQYLFWDKLIFEKNNPTTFKKLTFKKEKKTADVYKKLKYSDKWNKKKLFRSFSFIAEYEDNITVELLVEYEKDKKDFEKAEEKALFYSKMYGQMPHFIKTHNKKIYIHNDFAESSGSGRWWVEYQKREFHFNPKNCKYPFEYSRCAVIMVHELAHVIQQLTGVIRPSKWMTARKLDKKKYASEYAKTNSKEDFAESLTAWVVVRYKSNKISKSDIKKFNSFIPNRFKLFDEMNFNMYPI